MASNGILLHVYHLNAKDWEQLAWGLPDSDQLGTVTQFAYTLLTLPADESVRCIIFSGPSTKDELTEGAYTKRFLLERIDELSKFPSLKKRIDNLSPSDYDVFLRRIHELVVGPVIENTLDEVSHAAAFFNKDDAVDSVYQIAVASHAPRCLKSQLIARRDGSIPKHQPWYVIASDVCFSGTELEDVVILEPPHRGDDPMVNYVPTLASVIKPYFAMDAEEKQQLIQTIQTATSQNKEA